MISRCRTIVTLLLIGMTIFSGCRPTQPFFLHEDGDLSHLLQTATELEYPDVEACHNPEAALAHAPLTISNLDAAKYADLTLEQAVSITLQNSKVIRNLGGLTQRGFADALIGSTTNAPTVFDPALTETAVGSRSEQLSPSLDGPVTANQVGGTESALSQFDTQFEFLSGLGGTNAPFFSKTERPQNIVPNPGLAFFAPVLDQQTSNVTAQIRKRTATGTTVFARSTTAYDLGNSRGGVFNPDGTLNPNRNQALNSFWTQALEIEVVQPLMRGRGTFINRIPIVLARLNSDITLASFEGSVRNLVMDVENTYWDLHCAYLNLDTQRTAFDSAHVTWKIINARKEQGKENAQAEAQSREQFYFFRSQMESALRQVLDTEARLRFLMGIAPTDGRIIRPVDTPSNARIQFDWESIRAEALCRSPELRQQKFAIKQRELELASAKNQLLPRFDARAIYRWVGAGDNWINADRNGIPFPLEGSAAFEELTGGDFQEFSVGFDFVPARFGARRELSGVRGAELQLVRAHAVLEDMELNTLHLLSTAVRDLDFFYNNAQSHYSRLVSANEDVQTAGAQYVGGKVTANLVLQAQERRSRAQADYNTALCEYTKAIANIHFRKGSLLEFNNVCLAEGPWPKKAYWDAHERARERDASLYFDYGFTAPNVVSRGPIQQHEGTVHQTVVGSAAEGTGSAETSSEVLPEPMPAEAEEETIPEGPIAARNQPRRLNSILQTGAIGSGAAKTPRPATSVVPAVATEPAKAGFDWGDLGSKKPHRPAGSASKPSSAVPAPVAKPLQTKQPSSSNPLRGQGSGAPSVSLR